MYQELRDIRIYNFRKCKKLLFWTFMVAFPCSVMNWVSYLFGKIALFAGPTNGKMLIGEEKWNFLAGAFIAAAALCLVLFTIYRIANHFDVFLFERFEAWTIYDEAPLTIRRVLAFNFLWFIFLILTAVCVTYIVYGGNSPLQYFTRFLLIESTGLACFILFVILLVVCESCRRCCRREQIVSNGTRENMRTLWNSIFPEQVEGVNIQTIRQTSAESGDAGDVVIATTTADIERAVTTTVAFDLESALSIISSTSNSDELDAVSRNRAPQTVCVLWCG